MTCLRSRPLFFYFFLSLFFTLTGHSEVFCRDQASELDRGASSGSPVQVEGCDFRVVPLEVGEVKEVRRGFLFSGLPETQHNMHRVRRISNSVLVLVMSLYIAFLDLCFLNVDSTKTA